MRGLFTSGVLDVFMENGITVDCAVGVSAGAVFGSNYKSGQIGRGIRYNLKYTKDPRYKGIRSLLFTGDAFGAEFCFHTLPNELDRFDTESFRNSPMDLYCVTTDVITGEPVYHKFTDGGYEDLEWMRASASMPLVSNIVNIGGQKLLDGGITDSIPLGFMESLGYERNIVIHTKLPTFVRERYSAMPLVRLALHKYPALTEKIGIRHEMYNSQVEYCKKCEAEGTALGIWPEVSIDVSAMTRDTNELQRIYDHGREVGLKVKDKVRTFIEGGTL